MKEIIVSVYFVPFCFECKSLLAESAAQSLRKVKKHYLFVHLVPWEALRTKHRSGCLLWWPIAHCYISYFYLLFIAWWVGNHIGSFPQDAEKHSITCSINCCFMSLVFIFVVFCTVWCLVWLFRGPSITNLRRSRKILITFAVKINQIGYLAWYWAKLKSYLWKKERLGCPTDTWHFTLPTVSLSALQRLKSPNLKLDRHRWNSPLLSGFFMAVVWSATSDIKTDTVLIS